MTLSKVFLFVSKHILLKSLRDLLKLLIVLSDEILSLLLQIFVNLFTVVKDLLQFFLFVGIWFDWGMVEKLFGHFAYLYFYTLILFSLSFNQLALPCKVLLVVDCHFLLLNHRLLQQNYPGLLLVIYSDGFLWLPVPLVFLVFDQFIDFIFKNHFLFLQSMIAYLYTFGFCSSVLDCIWFIFLASSHCEPTCLVHAVFHWWD